MVERRRCGGGPLGPLYACLSACVQFDQYLIRVEPVLPRVQAAADLWGPQLTKRRLDGKSESHLRTV